MKIKFVRVSYTQLISRVLAIQDQAQELQTFFQIPCSPRQIVLISRVLAQQFKLRFSNVVLCSDGRVYGSNLLDIGSEIAATDTVHYILVQGLGIRGRDAALLQQLLRRVSAIAIELHNDRAAILYSI